ncbi:MAG: hypothetical protein C0490_17335 [Marivirga sp.]|nr:hypothetical protein [Marivirga sp.]
MKRFVTTQVLLFVSCCFCYSQSLSSSELRDLKLAITKSDPDSTRVDLLLEGSLAMETSDGFIITLEFLPNVPFDPLL